MTDCYHCGSPVPANHKVSREIAGTIRLMCCEGCATVAAVIHASGLNAYYEKRTALPQPVDNSRQSLPQAFAAIFDDQIVTREFVSSDAANLCSAQFVVQHMHCPTCSWLIESRVGTLPGMRRARVNFRTQKLTVSWQADELDLSDIVLRVHELGYSVAPFSPSVFSETVRAQHLDLLKRLGVAGVFGMQIMVIAVALYSSQWTFIDTAYEELFRRLSLLFVLPILFYSAAPIFWGALRDLKQRAATMDVPIALALLMAFIASLATTLSGTGEVYYDSIAMFVFFQLIARFLEKGAYRRMTDRITALSAVCPSHANRLADPQRHDSAQVVPALRLQAGDYVLINPGEAVPADGTIISGASNFDEAILTGESNAVQHETGDGIFSGSLNLTNPVVAQVACPSTESALAAIVNLLENSLSEKPSSRRLTDRLAGRFSITVVALAACVGTAWLLLGNSHWLEYTIAVLIVACPCALALAVPTALTAAVNGAAKRNILLAHPDAVRDLAKANTFVFDKTGTLTQSRAQLTRVETTQQWSEPAALRIATALSYFSEHPICRALAHAGDDERTTTVENIVTTHGGGIQGQVDGHQYYFGSAQYIEAMVSGTFQGLPPDREGLVAYLSTATHVIATLHFDNPIRSDSKQLIARLNTASARLVLVTGDRQREAERVAAELGIAEVHWECSPARKLEIIRDHQARGDWIAMVGDGVNDAPTLAAANVSITPATAQQIAKAHADVLLLDDRLELLSHAQRLARFTTRIMRTNTVWAIAYNLVGISLAAVGLVPPLVAAIGMSASSMLVVGNSLRILSLRHNTA